jgi:hypothetical protein
MAYNFAKRLKTLRDLTPYEHICKVWTTQPNQFRLNPLHHTVGLNSYPSRKWPNADSIWILSQIIFVIASIGTARIAPGTPHIQYQKMSAMMTRTGFRVKRRANSMGVI